MGSGWLRAPLKLLDTIVLWYLRAFRRALNWAHMMIDVFLGQLYVRLVIVAFGDAELRFDIEAQALSLVRPKFGDPWLSKRSPKNIENCLNVGILNLLLLVNLSLNSLRKQEIKLIVFYLNSGIENREANQTLRSLATNERVSSRDVSDLLFSETLLGDAELTFFSDAFQKIILFAWNRFFSPRWFPKINLLKMTTPRRGFKYILF